MELSLATVEDMVAELAKRNLAVVVLTGRMDATDPSVDKSSSTSMRVEGPLWCCKGLLVEAMDWIGSEEDGGLDDG